MFRMRIPYILLLFVWCVVLLSSCGTANSVMGENYGDLLSSPSGLILTESEHPDGWGRWECDTCHNLTNIHLGPNVDGYDMAAIRELVAKDGISVCHLCHGDNGVE